MKEMTKLVEMLMDDKIQFQMVIQKDYNTSQLLIPNSDNPVFSVVCNKYSEGGISGLLEILCWRTNVCKGCLTAQDAYNIIAMKGGG